MQKILGVTEPLDLTPDQISDLEQIAKTYNLQLLRAESNPSRDAWIEFVSKCSFVISGKQGLSAKDASNAAGSEGVYQAPRGLVISHPFVNVAWVDKQRLAGQGVTLLYAPGCNRDAVAEWVLSCSLNLFRGFKLAVNKRSKEPATTRSRSLTGKTAAILGKGAVGARVGEVLSALKMRVNYLERGSAIDDVVRDAELVVNCLSSKAENSNILNADFFASVMPRGSIFVSMTNPLIYDIDGLLSAIRAGQIRGAAIDVGNTFPGDTEQANYKRFTEFLDQHAEFENSLLVTPQVAHFSDASQTSSFNMAIDNIRHAVSGNLAAVAERVWGLGSSA